MIVQKDDSILLKNIIHTNLKNNLSSNAVELIIRPECNQQCEYCYITKYRNKLYPEIVTNDTILKNLQFIIQEFISQKYIISRFDLFAGDLFYDNLFFSIIPIIEQYYIFLQNNNIQLPNNPKIMIPCNMSFCADNSKIDKVRNICQEFLEKYNVRILFSYSTDGIYSTHIREKKDLKEEYFDTIFALCEEMKWCLHPMISYENIDNAIDNYEWFKIKFKQFKVSVTPDIPLPTYLEVRNDGWSEESIEKYKQFLLYYLNDVFKNFYNSDINQFFESFYNDYTNSLQHYQPNNLFGNLQFKFAHSLGCTIGNYKLMINVQNLSFVPCHRLTYPEFIGGKYICDNEKIIDIEAGEQINTYLNLKHYNARTSMQCCICKYNPICMKGCLGSQYEKFGDATIPNPNVCKMLQVKYDTELEFFHSIGLFHHIFKNYKIYPENKLLKILLLSFGYNEYEQY